MFSFSSVCVCVCVKVVVSVLCHVTTFCTALDLDTPGRPLPDFIFCPRTSCFRLLTRTSNGLFFGSLLFSLFFFFLATTSADSLFLGFPILLALVFYITPHSTWKFHPHVWPFTFHLSPLRVCGATLQMENGSQLLNTSASSSLRTGRPKKTAQRRPSKEYTESEVYHILRCHAYNYNSCCFHCLVGKGCTGRGACIGSRPSTNSQTTTRRWVSILDVRCPPVSPSLPCWGTDCRDDSGELCRLAVFTRCVKLLNSEQLQSQTAQELVGKLLVEVYTCRV